MAGKPTPESNYNVCLLPTGHQEHLCRLMDRGQTAEVRQRSDHPAFFCRNCKAVGNLREDLCNPAPIED